MQADGSVVVSELAVVVLLLARSIARQCSTWRSLDRTPIFNTINTLPVRLPTAAHVPMCRENDSYYYKTWQ